MGGTPVGISDVVRMNYKIGIGKMDTGMELMLAYTDSFTIGVSLSSISWGFVNPASNSGDSTNAKITVTIHDIAGQLFNNFVKVRQASYYIYFRAPQSDGALMGGEDIVYRPDPEECTIEFSQTQGFTYTLSGTPIVMTARTSTLMPHEPITITGETEGVSKSGTFKDYIKELEILWNRQCQDKPTAQIEVLLNDTKPYKDRKPNNTMKSDGHNPDFINFTAERGPLAESIRRLWESSFRIQTDTENKVNIEIAFKEFKGGPNKINIRFYDKDDEPGLSVLNICIGDDVNCWGQIYRGQLSGINFNAIAKVLFPTEGVQNTTTSDPSTAGNDTATKAPAKRTGNETSGTPADGATEVEHVTNGSQVFNEGVNESSWNEAVRRMNSEIFPDFTMSVEMPYTSDFTPILCGGLLKDAVDGTVAAAIDITQGVQIIFFWYDTPLCETLVINPMISTTFRISKVTHTIGLNGNTTQVELSHVQLR